MFKMVRENEICLQSKIIQHFEDQTKVSEIYTVEVDMYMYMPAPKELPVKGSLILLYNFGVTL